MTEFMATINTPGYLPFDDEAHVFDTPSEAWQYLADERERDEDSALDDPETEIVTMEYSETWHELNDRARLTSDVLIGEDGTGTVYGSTPGSNSEHDLGIAYNVEAVDATCSYCKQPGSFKQLESDGFACPTCLLRANA